MGFIDKITAKIKRYWKWGLLFLFLPTMNGCNPSIGYPFSIPVKLGPRFNSYFLIYMMLNIIIFYFTVDRIVKYFVKHEIQFTVFFAYAVFEAFITLISMNHLLTHIGMFSISWWVYFGITAPFSENLSLTLLYTLRPIAMLLTTYILYIGSKSIEKFVLRKTINNNKSP